MPVPHHYGPLLAFMQDAEFDQDSWGEPDHSPRQVATIFDGFAVDRIDHIAGDDAGFAGGAVCDRFGDESTAGLLEPKDIGESRRQRLKLRAEPTARDRSLILELRDHGICGFGRNRKGDAD